MKLVLDQMSAMVRPWPSYSKKRLKPRILPPEIQHDIARVVMMMAGKDEPILQMTAEEEASFAESRAQAGRGDFASDERMQAIWSKNL